MTERTKIQALSAFLSNAYLKGFVTGNIFTGSTKHFCIPTLNCYSCPGALFACPVGAVQVVLAAGGGFDPTAPHTYIERITSITSSIPFFAVGFLTLIGSLIGRATCGWACPFGFLQELLFRIPSPKLLAPKFLRYVKFVFLLLMVILLPLLYENHQGIREPTFCKFICPAGTLEGGVLLPILKPDLRNSLGYLYLWKISLLMGFMVTMVFFRRPFCGCACPLGAFLGLFNKFSLWKLRFSVEECIACNACRKVCPISLEVTGCMPEKRLGGVPSSGATPEINQIDCIRCLECQNVCPKGAITFVASKKAKLHKAPIETAQ